MKVHNDGIW